MSEVPSLNEGALLSAKELEKRVAMGDVLAVEEKARRLKEIKKPRARVSAKTKRSVVELKQLAAEGNVVAEAEIQRRLKKVKATTLSERAKMGDKEAVKKVNERKEARARAETTELTEDDIEIISQDNKQPSSEPITSDQAKMISGEINTKLNLSGKEEAATVPEYASFEIIEEDLSEGMKKEIDGIIDVFHQTKTQNEFLDYVLKKSNFLLSQEKVAADPTVRKYLEKNFKQQGEFGPRLEDFIFMLPTEQDFVEHAAGKKRQTLEIQTHKVFPAPVAEPVPGLVSNEEAKQKMAENAEAYNNEKYLEKTVELFLVEDASSFKRLMLEGDLVHYALTKEDAIKDSFASVLLKYLIENNRGKKELKALVAALPTKLEYDTEGWPAQKRTEVQELGKKVRRKSDEFMAQSEELEIFKQALSAYAEAYKKFDSKFTKDKPNSLIALIRPPLLAFSAPAKELKRLYKALNIARKNAEREGEEEEIRKNLDVARTKPVINKEALPMKARKELAASSEAEEEAARAKYLPNEEAWYEQAETKKETGSELTWPKFEPVSPKDYIRPQKKKIEVKMPKTRAELSEGIRSSEKVTEYLSGIIEQQAEIKNKKMDEIVESFVKKYKMSDDSTRKFLLGPEVRGLFNGKQRQMQREYKLLYGIPPYKL